MVCGNPRRRCLFYFTIKEKPDMNKYVIALSIIGVLTACTDNHFRNENELEPGIMRPVKGTGAIAEGSFEPQIQPGTLPANMQ